MKAVLTFFVMAWTLAGAGQNWPQWRGPFFNGSSPATNLPRTWSTKENVAWVAPLPGFSGATPAIWADSVFVSSPDASRNLLLICFHRQTGEERWRQTAGSGDRDKGRNNTASPSPVTDGTNVYVIYATGDLNAFNFSGEKVWSRELGQEFGPFANMWIYGSSPLLYRGRLYVQVLQRSPVPPDYPWATPDQPNRDSFLLCLDAATGKTLWRHTRVTDARQESQEAYSTPIPLEGSGGLEILVVGANFTTAHRWDTGREEWRCGGLNPKDHPYWRIVPSPVVAGDTIVVCAPKRDPVFGIKVHGDGETAEARIAWSFQDFPSDCATPLYYCGKLFVLDGDRQVLTCLDPTNGKRLWQGQLGIREIFRASPTGADGRIYCISEGGTAVVLGTGDEFKILGTIRMGEGPVRSSVAVAGNQLFIRTAENLYCIGSPEKETATND